jgi:hypothetical protein
MSTRDERIQIAAALQTEAMSAIGNFDRNR